MRFLLLFAFTLAVASLIASPLLAQQAAMPDAVTHHDYIPLAAVPTTIADAMTPSADRQSRVIVRSIWFVNTNASTSVTVTVTCKTTGTIFVKATIPGYTAGANNVPVQLPADGVSCEGGVRWVADGAGLNGYMTGTY
ncbi:MAG TPA: hypothetical protein VHY84_14980 [Bryobacteraceae bacterium]|jgi:hypothetical protein|nr:hypothetical protein [Bryobacteraceae bacterium]